jgi:hypothetical protein
MCAKYLDFGAESARTRGVAEEFALEYIDSGDEVVSPYASWSNGVGLPCAYM